MFLSIILATPMVAAVVIMFLPRERTIWPRWVALAGTFLTLVLTAILYFRFDTSTVGYQFPEIWPFLSALGIQYAVAVDGMGLAMVVLTAIIIFAGVLASWDMLDRSQEFFALLLVLVTGVFGVFMARDLFFFFLFYELAVLPMYLLIGIWGTGKKEYSAMKLTLYLMAGSALLLVGILALFFNGDTHSFQLAVIAEKTFSKTFQIIFFHLAEIVRSLRLLSHFIFYEVVSVLQEYRILGSLYAEGAFIPITNIQATD